jgi:iron(III) transport system permease protein
MRQRYRPPWPQAVLFIVLAILLAWPAAMLVIGAFRTAAPGSGGEWTGAAFAQTFGAPGTLQAIGSSVLLAIVTTLIGTTLAAGFAFLAARTDLPLRGLVTPAMLIMFATPPLFYAVGYSLLANQYTGLFNAALHAIPGLGGVTVNIESWPGLLLVTTFRTVAFIYLFLIGPFRALDRAHEDASFMSGVGTLGTFWRIDLPILAPALTGAAILGIMAGLQVFDTALIIGTPAHIVVISTQIYTFLINSSPPKYADASVLSTLLILIAGGLSIWQSRMLGRRSFVTVGGKTGNQARYRLRAWTGCAAIGVAAYITVAEILPLGSLIYSSLQAFPGVYGALTLNHYASALARPGIADAFRTTVILALVVGFTAMIIAVAIAEVGRTIGARAKTLLRFLTLIPYAMTGIVTALAVTWAYVSVPIVSRIYGTIWLLVLALIIVVMPLAAQAAQAAVAQIGPELREAARTSGASSLATVIEILAPLIAPSFFTGWYIAAVVVAGNLDIPLVLGAPGLTTLAAIVYQLNSEAKIGDSAALLVLMLVAMVALGTAGFAVAALLRRERARPMQAATA